MNNKIQKLATEKFNKLKKRYDKFVNVGVDNWRGFRFVFDTKDVRKCRNNCKKCELYKLLKNEGEGFFSGTLYPANYNDKKLFGRQNFLNCKTLKQYRNCYINFLSKKCGTEIEMREEVNLVINFKIIYSQKTKDLIKLENEFKKKVFQKTLNNIKGKKRQLLTKILAEKG